MPLRIGDTFFLHGTGGTGNPAGAHLMVCLAVDAEKDTAIVVPVVTRREYSDTACLLDVGDHPFIKHESCAAYDFARAVNLGATSEDVDKGRIKLKGVVGPGVIKRLQVGFVLSDETTPYIFEAGNGRALTAWLKHQGLLD